jgi:hypothetical protein
VRGARHRLALPALAALAFGCAAAGGAATPEYRVHAECRGAVAEGRYEALGPGGDRIEGHYCNGERCGVFTFYSGPDVRVAELPYRGRVLNGTARVWYLPHTAIDSPHHRKSTAEFVDGRRHGDTRTWWPTGVRRTDFAYRQGAMSGGTAWSPEGEELPPDEAMALARHDADSDRRLFLALGSIIGSYPPDCGK